MGQPGLWVYFFYHTLKWWLFVVKIPGTILLLQIFTTTSLKAAHWCTANHKSFSAAFSTCSEYHAPSVCIPHFPPAWLPRCKAENLKCFWSHKGKNKNAPRHQACFEFSSSFWKSSCLNVQQTWTKLIALCEYCDQLPTQERAQHICELAFYAFCSGSLINVLVCVCTCSGDECVCTCSICDLQRRSSFVWRRLTVSEWARVPRAEHVCWMRVVQGARSKSRLDADGCVCFIYSTAKQNILRDERQPQFYEREIY